VIEDSKFEEDFNENIDERSSYENKGDLKISMPIVN
jgi:hypothetical protein